MWYSMEVTSAPSPPAKSLEVECPAHGRVTIEVLVENPSEQKVEFEVTVDGADLVAGDDWLIVHPGTSGIYEVAFAPTTIGKQVGR